MQPAPQLGKETSRGQKSKRAAFKFASVGYLRCDDPKSPVAKKKQSRLVFNTSATVREPTTELAGDSIGLNADSSSKEVPSQACVEKDAGGGLLPERDDASPSAARSAGFTEIIGDGLNQATSSYVHQRFLKMVLLGKGSWELPGSETQ